MSTPAQPRPAIRPEWLFVAAAVLLAGLIYAPVRHFGYINLDDPLFVRDNPWLALGWHWPSLRWAMLANLTEYSRSAEYWAPLTLLSRLAEAQLWGMNPGAFHLVSAGLHLVNAGLVALVLRRLTGKAVRSAVVALFFLVHPLQVEAVCWLSARKDLLNGTFFLLTLLAYERYVRRQNLARYAVVLAAYVGCLMAKPMGVTVPFLLLLLDWYPLGRWPARTAAGGCRERLRLLAEKAPLALLAGGAAALAVQSQRDWGAMGGEALFSIPVRLANALLAAALYLRRIVWPSDLAVYYPHPGEAISRTAVVVAGLILVALGAAAWRGRKRAPVVLAGGLWFILVLGPVIGLVQIGGQAMADRYAYLALLGPLTALVWCGAELLPHRWPGLTAQAALVVIALAASQQAWLWRSDEALFTHTIAVTEKNALAHVNLASAFMEQGRDAEAAAHLREAIRIAPGSSLAWNNLARAELDLGHESAALSCYASALVRNRDNRESLLFYGRLLKKRGDLVHARIILEHLREIAPELPQPWSELGALYASTGQWHLALTAWEGYRRFHPGDPEAERQSALARANAAAP